MAEEAQPTANAEELKFRYKELEFRRHDANLGVWKVVIGTFAVGVAGAIFTFAAQIYSSNIEDSRKTTETLLSQKAADQQYIKEFFTTAINQDIELRIRFAEYFEYLTPDESEKKQLWRNYHERLVSLRGTLRVEINDLEKAIVTLLCKRRSIDETTELDKLRRELDWKYTEIGYAPIERSRIAAPETDASSGRKLKLYSEAIDRVRSLAKSLIAPVESSTDVVQFWQLYRHDLIGVESREFARLMISIGNVIRDLVEKKLAPDGKLDGLLGDLENQANLELGGNYLLLRAGGSCAEFTKP